MSLDFESAFKSRAKALLCVRGGVWGRDVDTVRCVVCEFQVALSTDHALESVI